MGQKIIKALVDGGKATPAPPLGPSLSAFKVNIGKIIQEINEKTKEYEGMKVPVSIIIDDETKEYEIEVGVPPVSSLVKKELGLKKLSLEKEKSEEEEKEEENEGKEAEKEVKDEVEKEEIKKDEKETIVGNLTMDQIIKITRMKMSSLLAKDKKKAVKEVVGACVSMPVTIENKSPKEILREIDEGKYDEKISKLS